MRYNQNEFVNMKESSLLDVIAGSSDGHAVAQRNTNKQALL